LLALAPGRHAAAHVEVAADGLVDRRVEDPELRAGFGVEGEEPAEGRGDVEPAVDDERRRLEGRAGWKVRTVAHVAGGERPGHFELGGVAAVDLGERRVARPARVAARVRPLLGDGGRRHEEDERERLGDSGQGAPARAAILAWLSREGVWPRLVQTLGRKQ